MTASCRLLFVLTTIFAHALPIQLDAQTFDTSEHNKGPARIHRPLGKIEVAQTWRDESPERYVRVEADFDGDGHLETAFFIGNHEEYLEGTFFLYMKFPHLHPPRIDYLAEADLKELPVRGIELVDPGEYETACGKGQRKCGPNEPATLKLTRPAICFFEHEGSRVFFYFDVDAAVWVRVDIDL